MASRLGGIVDAALIDRIADELYALPPARFVAARDAHARLAAERGDRALAGEIAALRKPTAAAWALNVLARTAPADLAGAAALGEELRAAGEEPAGDVPRQLAARRRAVLGALVRLTGELAREAGRPLGAEVVQQVRATLAAAFTDHVLAARIRTGRLVKPVERTGAGRTAATGRDDLAPRRARRRERQLAGAGRDADAARADARRADVALAEATRELEERTERTEALRAELRRAQRAEHEAAGRTQRARRRAETAHDRLTRAEQRLTELRGDA
ncbi:hypothetical protein [Saccharothrix syringae]|uniref:Uncharacterized protein n=1 Tax=Saccharothrix syringae TaxID=103733 RepID=A0A5Q0HB99_SACSY|nr:hypothetical protein [Saccharothrix syringae]QFZ23090.1 hypothetical protein EKG83_41715 [Saccharothrix syringae]